MAVDHKITRTSENFKGLDLRSSDIVRGQDFATDMRNAAYRISGAINKRKGFVHKGSSGSLKGMTTFKNISSNGSVTDELVYVEDNKVKKEVQFDLVAYRAANVSTTPIEIKINKSDTSTNITASDGGSQNYFDKTYSGSDTISSFTGNFLFDTLLPSGSGTKVIQWENIDLSQCRIQWHVPYSTSTWYGVPYKHLDKSEHWDTLFLYIPVSQIDKALLTSFNNAATFTADSSPLNSIHNHAYRGLTFGGKKLLIDPNFDLDQNGEITPIGGIITADDMATDYRLGYFNNAEFVLDSNNTNPQTEEWLRFKINMELDTDPDFGRQTYYGSYFTTSDNYFYRNLETWNGNNRTALELMWNWGQYDGYSAGELYNTSNFRHVFTWAVLETSPTYSVEVDSNYVKHSGTVAYQNTYRDFYTITLQDMIDGYNDHIAYSNTIIGQSLENITRHDLFGCDAVRSDITLELRNADGVSVPGFLSENINALNTNTTSISNNSSNLFPTTVTTGNVEQEISTLTWTSSNYDNILTENVNFASLNNVLYISNGIDDLMKYDGNSVYRAGLPNTNAYSFTLNSASLTVATGEPDTADSYLHDVNPGQVELFTLDDSVYSNVNSVDEALVADRKYHLEFRNNGGTPQFRRKHGAITGSYGSFSAWADLSAYGSTSVLNGSGFAVEVTTDGLGYVKDYYQVAAGTGYLGQADNGTFPNFIEITKAMFLYSTSNNNSTLTYGRLDIVDVSSQLRDKTYEYKFSYEYTDFKGNIVRSQPSESRKIVVPSNRKVVINCPTTVFNSTSFDTTSTFDTAWEGSTGITLDALPATDDYQRAELLKKFKTQKRMRILIYRTKGYYPTKGEVAGQFYQIADIPYGTASFEDFYHDEPNDAEAPTQYDLVLNPFLAFNEPIKRKDLPPKGKYLTVFKNCLVVSGQNDNVNNVSYSLPKNFITGEIGSEYFPDDDNAVVVESPFGSKITGIAALKDLMFVFHRDSIFALSGNINQLELPTVDLVTKEGGVGCTSQASIEEFNGGLSFVSDTGVYSISNRGLEEISDLIKPLFLDSNFVKEKAISFNWTDKNLLLICIPDYVVQGDSNYNPGTDTETVYVSKDSLIIAYDYFRQAWLRWDTLEFTDGIALLNNKVNFARATNVGNFTATISDNGDTDDYSDNGQPINFVYETNWESLGDPTVPKKYLRIKIHSFDTDQQFESSGFLLEAGIQKNYYNYNDGKIDFDFAKTAEGGWGNFRWGDGQWGSQPSTFLKSKLPTGKAKSLKIRFANNTNNQNVLITNYELEIAAPYRQEIK